MRIILALIILMLTSTISFATARADDTYAGLVGKWTCTSDLGSIVNQTYSLTDDGVWLRMLTSWNNPEHRTAGYFDNYFYRNPANGWWNTTSHGANGWSWAGRSSGWKNDALVFDGIQETFTGPVITRETITRSGDGKLQHLWEAKLGANGTYVVTSRSMCERNPQ